VLYDLALAPVEALGLSAERERVITRATGRVLEVGAGTGLNLMHYSRSRVSEVVLCEPDDVMRHRLARRAAHADVDVALIASGVPGLPFAPASFDTIVCVLVLCTVAEPHAALTELRGLVKPDGQLLFLEHVLARTAMGAVQRRLAPSWAKVACGCRLDRDTIGTMQETRWVIADCERPKPLGRLSAQMVVRGRAVPRA
jgi:SAM-dependent methyltransferase